MNVKYLLFFIAIFFAKYTQAQIASDADYMSNIQSVQFTVAGKPLLYPVVNLGEVAKLRLDFDDLDNKIKNYYYTFVHCNADWQPSVLFPANYIKGFVNKRITNYKPSVISKTRYMHYTVYLPEKETLPTHSGNYMLKVFLDGDTSKLAFTRRLMITENIAGINAAVKNPFDAGKSFTHQKVNFEVNASMLNITSPYTQIKVNVLQNYRWDNASMLLQPNFIKGNIYEYNDENTLVFQSGKEYRWLDLTHMRMKSDKIASIIETENMFKAELHTESDRVSSPFLRYDDFNGSWIVRTTDANKTNTNINGDYALVTFKFAPSNLKDFTVKDIYLAGRMTNYLMNDKTKMIWNPVSNIYEQTLLLKEGYYTYNYVSILKNGDSKPEFAYTEGNDWQTENNYTILVYYRAISDFADRLVGIKDINSAQMAN